MRDKIISKNLLQTFIKQKRLSGVADFLHFIRSKNNLQTFCNFCNEHDQAIPKPSSDNILFHGSSKVQQILKLNVSMGKGGKLEQHAHVYSTDDPNYAIFLATLNLKNGSASVNATKKATTLFVDLDFVNGPSKLKNGYVHVVEGELFRKTKNREYKSNRQINILFTIPVSPTDITVPIYIQTE